LCSQPDQCTCFTGFTGEECQYPICFDKPASDPNVCSGKGSCSAPNNCSCFEGFYGEECGLQCPIPAIISSRYTIDATQIRIVFNTQMDTQVNISSCSDIFHDANKLGVNANCKYTSSTELKITIDEKISSGDTLSLKLNVLKDGICGYFVEDQKITILAPVEAQTPVAVLNGPSLLGDCQNLTLESASYGYGTLKYKWELVNNDLGYSVEIGNLLSSLSDTTTS